MAQLHHGVSVVELATATSTVTTSEASLPFIVGCAPVHRLAEGKEKPINEPKLISSYREYLDTFGELSADDSLQDYSLTMAAQVYFERYKIAPMVMVNVFDPEVHTTTTGEGEDAVTVPDVSKVTDTDIIGLQATTSQARTGLQLIEECFPRFRMVPGVILCPGYSSPAVGRAIIEKAQNINELFKAIGIIDIPDSVKHYSEASAWLNDNNLCSTYLIAMFGSCLNDGVIEPGSLHVAGCLGLRDLEYGGTPVRSPSSTVLSCEGMYHNGEQLFLTPTEANILNQGGVCTGLNQIGGLKLWGNLTTAWPGVTDVKDVQIAVRRIFNWVGNSIVMTAWQYLDGPVSTRLVDTIKSTFDVWINSLTARGYIIGGRIEVPDSDNPVDALMNGTLTFVVYIGASPAAGELSFMLRFDPEYLRNVVEEA